MKRHCTDGLSHKEFKKLQDSFNRTQMNVVDVMVNVMYFHEDVSTCGNISIDTDDLVHESCLRKEDHKGKHYCIDCGESWK